MSVAKLLVTKYNKRTLTTARWQVFNCEQIDNAVNLTANGSKFTYRSENSIPALYEVNQTVAQVIALCQKCCASTSNV